MSKIRLILITAAVTIALVVLSGCTFAVKLGKQSNPRPNHYYCCEE